MHVCFVYVQWLFNLWPKNRVLFVGLARCSFHSFIVIINEVQPIRNSYLTIFSVFIGAPRANDSAISSVYQPGTVNKCQVVDGGKPANCSKFEIDCKSSHFSFFNK